MQMKLELLVCTCPEMLGYRAAHDPDYRHDHAAAWVGRITRANRAHGEPVEIDTSDNTDYWRRPELDGRLWVLRWPDTHAVVDDPYSWDGLCESFADWLGHRQLTTWPTPDEMHRVLSVTSALADIGLEGGMPCDI